jgi:hypothetical protein
LGRSYLVLKQRFNKESKNKLEKGFFVQAWHTKNMTN